MQKLQEYKFTIIHRPGARHKNADAMSRIPCKQCGIVPADEAVALATVTASNLSSLSEHSSEELRAAQLGDPCIRLVLTSKEANQRPNSLPSGSTGDQRLWQLWDQLTVINGLLYRIFEEPKQDRHWFQLVVPQEHRPKVLAALHEGVAGGHLGQEKTFSRIKERFYWPGYWNDTRKWCQTCISCATRKHAPTSRRAPLGTIAASHPSQIMAMDILGPFPESHNRNSYILVVADLFTRWMEAFPIPNQEASIIANKLVDEVFMHFGIPTQLHSDQGPQFESKLMSEVCKLLGIQKSRTTPYHPQCDGMVECFNRTLLSMLATHCKDNPWNWEEHVQKVCFAYNTSIHTSTGYTPFYLMYGRQPVLPVDIQYGTAQSHQPTSLNEYAAELDQRLKSAFELVHRTTGIQHERQKQYYDRKVHGESYAVGDLVWVLNPKVPKNSSKSCFTHGMDLSRLSSSYLSVHTEYKNREAEDGGRWYILTD